MVRYEPRHEVLRKAATNRGRVRGLELVETVAAPNVMHCTFLEH